MREADGTVKVWGQNANWDGEHALSPIEVIPENGFDYEGEILKIGLGSYLGLGGTVILTSEGLYYWGSIFADILPFEYLDSDFSEGIISSFSKVLPTHTYGTEEVNPKSLPLNVEPEDVKMLFASVGVMTLTTYEGEVWEMRTNSAWFPELDLGDGFDVWRRIHRSTTSDGNTDGGILTNVVVARGSGNTTIALTSDGEIYTWGGGTLLGDGSEALDRTMATQMQKPTPDFEVKQIGMTGGHFNHRTYYLLSTDGELYSLGGNNVGQLGDFT